MRLYLLITVILLSQVATPRSTAQEHDSIVRYRLSDRILVLTSNTPTFNNVTAINTDRGIVVIDTTPSPADARQLRTLIEKEFGTDTIRYTINTHHHWDHFFGNQVFADSTIIAHEKAPEQMRGLIPESGHVAPWLKHDPVEPRQVELAGLEVGSEKAVQLQNEIDWFLETYNVLENDFTATYPTLTFSDRLTLDMGDLTIDLYYYGAADTDNSILIHVPEEDTVISGDLYWFGGVFTEIEDTSALDINRWLETIDTILRDDKEVRWLIGGHKNVWPGTDLTLRRNYIERLWTSLGSAHTAGLTLDEARSENSSDKYPELVQLRLQESIEAERYPADWYPIAAQHADNIDVFWQRLESPD
jgi:glyoxylase-like metal-dependent hydrolase (beta-lactamase superfamily II)